MKYDVGDELISPLGHRYTIVGYVFWDAIHRYYVHDGDKTYDWPECHLKHLKKVTNEEQSAV